MIAASLEKNFLKWFRCYIKEHYSSHPKNVTKTQSDLSCFISNTFFIVRHLSLILFAPLTIVWTTITTNNFHAAFKETNYGTSGRSGKRQGQLWLFIAFLFWAHSNELAVPRGPVQSEIGLMLPTTAPGTIQQRQGEALQRDQWLFLQGQSNWFSPRQIKYVSLPKIFSHLVCTALGGDLEVPSV